MKKTLALLSLLIVLLSIQSCEKCPSYDVGNLSTDSRVVSCFVKPGSYFIYSNTTDLITDSEYVYSYLFTSGGIQVSYIDGCSKTSDKYEMNTHSFHNGALYDMIYFLSDFPYGFYTRDSLNYCNNMFNTKEDTLILSNFSVSGNVYPTVFRSYPSYTLRNGDTIPTDTYIAPNYGIVRKTEHRRTGDVSWDLIRSHIVR